MVKHAGLSSEDYARQLCGGQALPVETTLVLPRPEESRSLESGRAIHDAALDPQSNTD